MHVFPYRRGKKESGDIDVLVTHQDFLSANINKKQKNNMLKNLITVLENCNLITETLSLGDTKFMVKKLHIQTKKLKSYFFNRVPADWKINQQGELILG